MMRNVAIGAVLGFGVMVVVLSIFGTQSAAPAPQPIQVTVAPVAGADASEGPATAFVPLKVAPLSPRMRQFQRANPGEAMVVMPAQADADAGR